MKPIIGRLNIRLAEPYPKKCNFWNCGGNTNCSPESTNSTDFTALQQIIEGQPLRRCRGIWPMGHNCSLCMTN